MKGGKNNDVQDLIRSVDQLEKQGSIAEALETWKTILQQDRAPLLLCRFGRLAMKADKQEEAYTAFVEARTIDPELPEVFVCIGIWHRDNGDLEGAVESLERAVSLGASSSNLTLLGAAQLQLGDAANARKSFEKAIQMNGYDDEAYYNLALTCVDEHPDRAVSLFQRAIEIDPEFAEAHSELGQTFRRLDKNSLAEYHLRKAIELDGTDLWAYLYLGNICWLKQDFFSAEELFKRAIELSPTYSVPYWCLANLYEALGRDEETQKLYQRATAIGPSDPEAHKRFGLYLRDIRQISEARVQLELALALDPEDHSIAQALADLRSLDK